MSIVATNGVGRGFGAIGARALSVVSSGWTSVALVAFAIVQQSLGHHNADNSWLFTVDEKILAGARPYVDVLETNPPASFLIYMPGLLLARALGSSVEFMTSVLVFLSAGLSIYLTGRILRAAGLLANGERALLLNAATFAFLVLPGFNFAEREHLAAIWILPMLALHAARMYGVAPRWATNISAGVLAGVVVSIKPHFALAVALSFVGVLLARRSWKSIVAIENIVATAVVGVYGIVVVAFFPDFFKVLPAILDAYVPVRQHLPILLSEPWFLINVVLFATACMIGGRSCLGPRVYPVIAASIGFTATYFWQGKGWMNHELPAIALLCLAIAGIVSPMLAPARDGGFSASWTAARPMTLFAALPAALCAPLLFGAIIQWTSAEEHDGLTAAVRRIAPAHPKLVALSPQLTAGFPLVRRLDGVWAGRAQRLWLTVSARMLIAAKWGDEAYRGRLGAYVADDAAMFLADVRANAPDVIIIDKDERIADAIAKIPDLASSLVGYAPVAETADFVLWTPRR